MASNHSQRRSKPPAAARAVVRIRSTASTAGPRTISSRQALVVGPGGRELGEYRLRCLRATHTRRKVARRRRVEDRRAAPARCRVLLGLHKRTYPERAGDLGIVHVPDRDVDHLDQRGESWR
jgi:hypothetical protein